MVQNILLRFVILIYYLVAAVVILYIFIGPFSELTGIGKSLDIQVISNTNTLNTKILKVKIKNNSSKWTDFGLIKSNTINVNDSDFKLVDSNGEILETDGRTKFSSVDLKRNQQKTVDLVFVDENNSIDHFDSLEFNSQNFTNDIKLPKAQYVKSDEELLLELMSPKTSSKEKQEIVDKMRGSIESSLTTNEDNQSDSNINTDESTKQTSSNGLATTPKQSNNELNFNNFEGEWGISNYENKGGSYLKIHFKSKNEALITLVEAQAPPSSRLADTSSKIIFNNEGVGNFSFTDDGWGSSGKGTITLKRNNSVEVLITYSHKDELALWNFREGVTTFTRNGVH